MKITKSQLKQIIKEEFETTKYQQLNENPEAVAKALNQIMAVMPEIKQLIQMLPQLQATVKAMGGVESAPGQTPATPPAATE